MVWPSLGCRICLSSCEWGKLKYLMSNLKSQFWMECRGVMQWWWAWDEDQPGSFWTYLHRLDDTCKQTSEERVLGWSMSVIFILLSITDNWIMSAPFMFFSWCLGVVFPSKNLVFVFPCSPAPTFTVICISFYMNHKIHTGCFISEFEYSLIYIIFKISFSWPR